MVEIKIELDKVTSLLQSYHILCAPTDLNQHYNPDIFKNLKVSEEEKKEYQKFLTSKGVKPGQTDSIRHALFFPECKNLDEMLSTYGKELPENVKKNLKAFETKFNSYLDKVKEKVNPLIESRHKESKNIIDNVYESAKELTGVSIEKPNELKVHIVEGLAPTSMGSDIKEGKAYIVQQTRNFMSPENSYLLTLIHESVAHQTVDAPRKEVRALFGQHAYDVEEGYAKLLTRKIGEKLLGRKLDYGAQEGLQGLAYNIFEKNWNSMNRNNFNSWYKKCLNEISNQCRR
jgi:hypothetical protein